MWKKGYPFQCENCRSRVVVPARSLALAIRRLKDRYSWTSKSGYSGPWRCADARCLQDEFDFDSERSDTPAAA